MSGIRPMAAVQAAVEYGVTTATGFSAVMQSVEQAAGGVTAWAGQNLEILIAAAVLVGVFVARRAVAR